MSNIAEEELWGFCRSEARSNEDPCDRRAEHPYAIERAGGYRGPYHVLLGVLFPLDGVGPSDIRAEN